MKRLLLFELLLLILATTFESDSPPGWFQQILPVNDQINDIFFLDSLTGWVVTNSNLSSSDSGYILKTTSGGDTWIIQNQGVVSFNVVQFLDNNTGYAGAVNPLMECYKTIDGGSNWFMASSMLTGLTDMFFVNNNTGWYCDPSGFGGLFKTTNGGVNWIPQLNDTYQPQKLFFINNDTGWVGTANWKLYRTTNAGLNWSLQYTFAQQINDIYFLTRDSGVVSSGFSYKTVNGGFNWTLVNDGGIKLSFSSNSFGWAGTNFDKIMRTTNGGGNWYQQTSPIIDNTSVFAVSDSEGWSGKLGLVHTTDGGGPFVGIQQISNEIPTEYMLFQNYPNPFNPNTIIRFQINWLTDVKIIVYDIQGKQVAELVNQKQNAGTYEVDFTGNNLSSGVYLYSLMIDGKVIDTKRMVLLK